MQSFRRIWGLSSAIHAVYVCRVDMTAAWLSPVCHQTTFGSCFAPRSSNNNILNYQCIGLGRRTRYLELEKVTVTQRNAAKAFVLPRFPARPTFIESSERIGSERFMIRRRMLESLPRRKPIICNTNAMWSLPTQSTDAF